jgi:uncharacterized protein YbjT (DUF2867 family)
MIAIMGASGKTGGWAAEALIKKGEKIRVIGRSAEHLQHLTERGAEPIVGDQEDPEFLTQAFKNADCVYAMIPPKLDAPDERQHYNKLGKAIVEAVKRSGVKKLVFLSSLGAERDTGTGPILGLHDVEKSLDQLKDVDIVFLRAGFFFENTLMGIERIKNERVYSYAADPDIPIPMVATRDIGNKAAELLQKRSFKGHIVEELFGDRLTLREVTSTLAKKLDIPNLRYEQLSGEKAIQHMVGMGMSQNIAKAFLEMSEAFNKGWIKPTTTNPEKPNAPTKYSKFVDEVYSPAYQKAA